MGEHHVPRLSRTLAGACALAGVLAWSPVHAASEALDWLHNLQDAQARAAVEHAPVMIDFYADWCGWCKVLDRRTYTDPRVLQLTERVIPVKVNTDLNPALARLYRVNGLPTVVFLDTNGQEISRVNGYRDAPAFASVMQNVLAPQSDIGLLQAAARTAPRESEAAYRLGDSLLDAALYDDAIHVLQPLAARAAHDRDPVVEDAALDLAHAYYLNTQYPQAADAYAAFLKHYPKSGRTLEAQLYLAHSLATSGKPKDAASLYRKIRKAAPKTWQGHEAGRALTALSAGASQG